MTDICVVHNNRLDHKTIRVLALVFAIVFITVGCKNDCDEIVGRFCLLSKAMKKENRNRIRRFQICRYF